MQGEIQQTATVNPDSTNYFTALTPQQGEWTAESLGIEVTEESHFTKADFECKLTRISRRIKS